MADLTGTTLYGEGIHGEVMAADLPYYLGRRSIIKTFMSQSRSKACCYVLRTFDGAAAAVERQMKLNSDEWMREMEERGHYVAYIYSVTITSRPSRARVFATQCGWQLLREEFLLQGEKPHMPVGATSMNDLGRGSFGVVQEVVVFPQLPDSVKMARKRIPLWRPRKAETSKLLQLVKDEVASLKILDHPNIINLLGCYEENIGTKDHVFNLLMYPVCDGDLSVFLHNTENIGPTFKGWLLHWFICLSSALAYVHSKGIRHEDIKPQNIVYRNKYIYLTDFSSARKFKLDGLTSTENPAIATRLYAAPEAMQDLHSGELSRHGSKSDIYSLGLVFLEMFTVHEGSSLDEFHDWLEKVHDLGKGQRKEYHRVAHAFGSWVGRISSSPLMEGLWNNCISKMLEPERSDRPNAADSFRAFREDKYLSYLRCDCCVPTIP